MSCVTRLALTVDTAGSDGAADTNREALETATLHSVHCQVNAHLKINRGPLCSSHTGRRDKVSSTFSCSDTSAAPHKHPSAYLNTELASVCRTRGFC